MSEVQIGSSSSSSIIFRYNYLGLNLLFQLASRFQQCEHRFCSFYFITLPSFIRIHVRKHLHVPMEPVVVNGATVDMDLIFVVLVVCPIVARNPNVENMESKKNVH